MPKGQKKNKRQRKQMAAILGLERAPTSQQEAAGAAKEICLQWDRARTKDSLTWRQARRSTCLSCW